MQNSSGKSEEPNDKKKSSVKQKLIMIASGIATGFANGFFGGGGGMITVPVLAKALKYEEKKAHATALLVILPISIFSSISYIAKGVIEWRTTLFVAAGVIVGGIVGAVFLKKISNNA
ncbi:MAG: sulfite exporter TauE/SafE family protein, partial [Clostridia bacterium]